MRGSAEPVRQPQTMCAHYENIPEPRVIRDHFHAQPLHPDSAQDVRQDLWPGLMGTFIVRPHEADAGDEAVGQAIALPGIFGLLPHWAKDQKFSRHTYNARSETVAEKPSFADAWRKARHCIVPARAIYEPDWSSGRAVATRITRVDGKPLGIAGLWSRWRTPDGRWLHSYTMLTINADAHPFMSRFHRPGEEKRMVVVLSETDYAAWLQASAASSRDFLMACDAQSLTAQA